MDFLLTYFIGTVLIAAVIGKLTGEKLYTFGQILTEVVRILCLNNFSKHPKLTIHNLILFGFMYYCFHANMCFQSQLTSILMKKSYTKDIDTLEELYDSKQDIFAFKSQIDEIKKIYSDTNYSDFAEHFKPFPDFTSLWELHRDAVYKISISKDYLGAFVTNRDRAEFISRSKTFRENGK